jgi:hypothetical protein
VLPDRPRGWRQISLSGRDWRLSYLDQNGDRRRMMVVSPSYYIFYDRVMTLFRQSTLCNNPRPTLCFSFNHDPPTSDCHPSPSPSNLPRFACEPPLQFRHLIHPSPMEHRRTVYATNPTCRPRGPLPNIWTYLQMLILQADFWNSEMSDKDNIGQAWRV